MTLFLPDKKLYIHGCGGHARSVADVAISNGAKDILFVDENARQNELILGFPVVKNISDYSGQHLIAIGDNHKRLVVFEKLQNSKASMVSLAATSAYLGTEYCLGQNVFVAHRAHIGPKTTIADNTIINTHCVIEHDCRIGKHSHISVNTVIAGSVTLGDNVTVGAGATIIDGIKVASNITIGAGAVVVADLLIPGVYVGVPARKR